MFSPVDICISSITTSELFYGAENSKYPAKNKDAFEKFLSPLYKAFQCRHAFKRFRRRKPLFYQLTVFML